jgi:hypothetical protein
VSFRDHKVLGVVGYVLVGLAMFAFGALVILKVTIGHSMDTYYSGRLIQWTYGGACITLVIGLVAAVVAGVMRLVYLRGRK